MSSRPSAGILGCGYRLPRRVRGNDDPIYAGLDTSRNAQGVYQSSLFRGLERRHYLGADESITDLVTESCRQALSQAELAATDVDRLYGYVTVPRYYTPNPLYQVHHDLELPRQALVVPINSEWTNFMLGLVHAADAVTTGTARHCLVACGNNYTQHIDYTQGHATSIGDGAAAALVGPSDRFVVIDHATVTDSAYHHALTVGVRALTVNGRRHLPIDEATGLPTATLEITQTGIEMLSSVYKDSLPELVNDLLARNRITGNQISLITHQGVRLLLDHWAERIAPKEHLETLAQFGNLIAATYPVNLAYAFDRINTDYVVIAGIGTGIHVSAVLLRV